MTVETILPAARVTGVALNSAAEPSAVAWGAIVAGAVAAISASIVLLSLGAGLGLSAVSPWINQGATTKAIGVAAIIWLVVVQWLSAGLGGYLTGRLRVRWLSFDRDEVYFRDTAHGFLAWALAIAIIALVATSVTSGILGAAANGAASGAAQGAANNNMSGYFSDSLFRTDAASQTASADIAQRTASVEDMRGETMRILARGDVDSADRNYLARLVAARTGLSQEEAQKRVTDVIVKATEAAAALAIGIALSLMIGAFISAVAAGLGGRLRDE